MRSRRIEVRVPLPLVAVHDLALAAADDLRHSVRGADTVTGIIVMLADFHLSSLSTFLIRVDLSADGAGTRMQVFVRPRFKLLFWTGTGQCERVAWELVGAMQRRLDPERYRALESAPRPPRTTVRP